MNQPELLLRIHEIEQQIAALPIGSITVKKVNGKEYYYHRWTENKKRREKYISPDEVEALREQIEHRKALESELKELRKKAPTVQPTAAMKYDLIINVRIGQSLRNFSAVVRKYKKRECYQTLHDFIYGEPQDKVFILYGLRRTGKTTMIRQVLAEMSDTDLAKTAFIQITAKNTLADVILITNKTI